MISTEADAWFKEAMEPTELDLDLTLCRNAYNGTEYLQHPLVTTLYLPNLNAMYNRQLAVARDRLSDALRGREWEEAVFTHARGWRLWAFIRYVHKPRVMPKHEAGDLLTSVWKDCEAPHGARSEWLRLFKFYHGYSPIMINSRAGFSKPVQVYRGMALREGVTRMPYGLSWTLDVKVAEWFASRFGIKGVVRTAYADPSKMFAYLPERGEQEIVVNPATLIDVRRMS